MGQAHAQEPAATAVEPAPDTVVAVRIEGNRSVSKARILNLIQTRAGRDFDPQVIQRDVRALATNGAFLDVEPSYQAAPSGRVVIFRVTERPTLRWVKYLGTRKVKKKTLAKKTGLKVGDAVDPYAVDEGRRKIEEHYREKGFNKVQVRVVDGSKPTDLGATYEITEGPQERVWGISFVGNTIVSDARLLTQIKSRPVFRNPFRSYVDRQKIDTDVDLLTAYYRSLGYFQARVSREPNFDEKGWLTLTFVIDEGPRFKIRDVSFLGNEKFDSSRLSTDLELAGGEFFDQGKMNADLAKLRDFYGSKGHIFADVQVDPRYHAESDELDLVYNIQEGKRCRVGKIYVNISGDHPHTRIQTVINRLSLKPGDIIDITKVRDDERRIIASQIFENNPQLGIKPTIVFQPPDGKPEELAGRGTRGSGFRGQSPDPGSSAHRSFYRNRPTDDEVVIDIHIMERPSPGVAPSGQPPSHVPRQAPPRRRDLPHTAPPATRPPQAVPSKAPRFRSGAVSPKPVPLVVRGQSPQPGTWTAQSTASSYTASGYGGTEVGQVGPGGQAAAATQNSVYQRGPRPPRYPNGYSPSPVPHTTYQSNSAAGANGQVFGAPPGGFPPNGTPSNGAPLVLGDPLGELPIGPQDEILDPRIPLIVEGLQEARTGRINVGVGVNSDAGLVGTVSIVERNFDWRRWPTSFEDIRNGTAWRGDAQNLRIELAPGTEVQRYLISWGQPYLFESLVSLNMSGFLFDRRYRDWDEQRVGGNVALGYQLAPDLSTIFTYRGENVKILDVAAGAPPELLATLGNNVLHGFKGSLVHDTRDSSFLPTSGHRVSLSYEQVVGTFNYGRGDVDARQYFLIGQRPDGSGRRVISVGGRVGVTGDDTPVYDHYFAGGYSTLRGWDFRGASPVVGGVIVGGEFLLLGSVEYLMPITADDTVRGVAFCDFGTVEPNVTINRFRVAPGFGLRVTLPALGPAPIALDFAFPVVEAATDDTQIFSFTVGFLR